MTSTIARSLNNFVSTNRFILNGVTAEGRQDKNAIADIIHRNASELRDALTKGVKTLKPSQDTVTEADEMLSNLIDHLDAVEQYIPEFTAISDLLDSLTVTSVPDFAKISLIEGTCAKIRSADRMLNMNVKGQQTMGGLQGKSDEQLISIAKRIGIVGDMHQRAFAWAYEGATMSDTSFVKKQITRRVKTIGDSLLAVDSSTRVDIIRYCNSVFLTRMKEDGILLANIKKVKNMNPGKRATTLVGGATMDLENAVERAMAKGMAKGADQMMTMLLRRLPELALMLDGMGAVARADAKDILDGNG